MKKVILAITLMAVSFSASAQLSVTAVNEAYVSSRLVTAGSHGISVASFKFTATGEDMKLVRLPIHIVDYWNNANVSSVKGVFIVDGPIVYGQDGAGATSPILVDENGFAKFSDLNIVIPKDGTKSIIIKVDTKTLTEGSYPGSRFKVCIAASSEYDPEIEAIGMTSGEKLNGIHIQGIQMLVGATVCGNAFVTYKSIPYVAGGTFTKASGFKVSGTALNGGAEIGQQVEIYNFAVAADIAGDVSLAKLSFFLKGDNQAHDLRLSEYRLVDGNGQIISGNFSDGITTNAELSAGTLITCSLLSEYVIAAGTSKTFKLLADIEASGIVGYYLSTKLEVYSPYEWSNPSFYFDGAPFVWSDFSANPHSLASADWNNGFLVSDLNYNVSTPVVVSNPYQNTVIDTVEAGGAPVFVMKMDITAPSDQNINVEWLDLVGYLARPGEAFSSYVVSGFTTVKWPMVFSGIKLYKENGDEIGVTVHPDNSRIFVVVNDSLVVPGGTTIKVYVVAENVSYWEKLSAYLDVKWVYSKGLQTRSAVEMVIGRKFPSNILTVVQAGTLPVELSSFEVETVNGVNLLKWSTASEKNNFGFEIEKSHDGINFEKIGFVSGNGTTTEKQSYDFSDKGEGKAYYRLKQVDLDGKFEYSKVLEVTASEIEEFQLNQNYPNPFNPETKVSFSLPKGGDVKLVVFDLLGREVASLVNENLAAGNHAVNFNGANLASGTYIYKLTSGNFFQVKKMTLSK